jgi:hypothetical protein
VTAGFFDPHNFTPLPTQPYDPVQFALEPAGTIARTLPRGVITSAALAAFTTGGQVAVTGITLPGGMKISTIATLTGTTAVSGQTHLWMGILDAALNVLAVTADQAAAGLGANALLSLALATPIITTRNGLYYIAASSSASTTAPTATGLVLATGVPNTIGNPVLCGTAGTQAAPPSVGAQLASGTVTANVNAQIAYWLS